MSSNNGTATLTPSSPATPKSQPRTADEEAQVSDYTEKHRKRIEAVTWRRAFFGSLLVVVLLCVDNGVLGNRYQHDVFVFRETAQGLSYAGQASEELTPDNFAIAHQLDSFIMDYRDVPGDDKLVDRNIARLLIMTGDVPPYNALTELRTHFSTDDNNPKMLAKKFTRAVRLNIDALHQPGTNTWHMQWIEDTTDSNGKTTPSFHEGIVTIAPMPTIKVPANGEAIAADSPGVTVIQYDLH